MKHTTHAAVAVRYQVEGWHNWPDAPEPRAYLRASHRHMFHYEVSVAVGTDEYDRGIEFHDLLDRAKFLTQTGDLGAQSCEMLANELGEKLVKDYPGRGLIISVYEDGEVGAYVQFYPNPEVHVEDNP